MKEKELAKVSKDIIESIILNGDISKLSQQQKLEYYALPNLWKDLAKSIVFLTARMKRKKRREKQIQEADAEFSVSEFNDEVSKMLIRQGDIILKEVNEIKGKKIAENEKVLALGEVTGHPHILRGKGTKFYQEQEQVYIEIPQEAELIHQEHENLLIQKGKYILIQQREFDLVEGVRQVTD